MGNERLAEIRDRNALNLSAGFTVESHRHGERGCRCMSCDVVTGYVIDTASGMLCDEQPEARNAIDGGCLEPVLSQHDAVNLVQSVKDVEALLAVIESLTHP